MVWGRYGNPHAAPLHGFDQTGEVAISGEQHHLIDRGGGGGGGGGGGVAPDLATIPMIDEFFARLCNNGETVISRNPLAAEVMNVRRLRRTAV